MSSLQVDSIAAIGGGHVDGAGKVVQCVLTTSTTSSSGSTAGAWVASTILDTSFTPEFSNSLIIVEVNLQINFASLVNSTGAGGAVRIKSGSNVIGGTPSSMLESFYTRTLSASAGAQLYSRLAKTVQDTSGGTGARTYSFEVQMDAGTSVFGVSAVSPSTMKITEYAQ